MQQPTLTNKIWNRACMGENPGSAPGDSALEAMISFHGVAMNGGVLHATECFTSEELEKAKASYQYFDIVRIPELICAAQALLQGGEDLDAHEEAFDQKYSEEIPDDVTLSKAFEAHYKRSPDSYAPIAEH
ncbi:MAG: hypothetical protein V4633_22845 [Pseudomonadota bacterium]